MAIVRCYRPTRYRTAIGISKAWIGRRTHRSQLPRRPPRPRRPKSNRRLLQGAPTSERLTPMNRAQWKCSPLSPDDQPPLGLADPPLPLPPLWFSGPSEKAPEPVIEVPPPTPMPPRIFSGLDQRSRSHPLPRPRRLRHLPSGPPPRLRWMPCSPKSTPRLLFVPSPRSKGQLPIRAGIIARRESQSLPPLISISEVVPRAPTLQIPSRSQARAFKGLAVDPSARSPLRARPAFQPTRQRGGGSLLRRIGRIIAWIVAAWLAVVLLMMIADGFVNPPASVLMLEHWLLGQKVVNTWVPLEDMSPNIVRAVIASEDTTILRASRRRFRSPQGSRRGGRKRLDARRQHDLDAGREEPLLWPSKSYVRKAIELPLTFFMELIWPKRRIMEVYLNIAEWGPGIFGIESAAQFRFNKPAKTLSAGQASRLAVALPNPLARNPARPGPGLQRLARAVQVRMRMAPSSRTSCILPRRRN